jgi:hypothetical protein
MKCVLDSYPDLDPDISEYMAGMLEDIDIFDTASDVLEAVGPFLMDAANASETDVQILSDMLFEMMKVNKKTVSIISKYFVTSFRTGLSFSPCNLVLDFFSNL